MNLNDIISNKSKFYINDGDQIRVFNFRTKKNTVTIAGAVSRPGTYDLGSGLKLIELINKADGLLGDVY